ncbi:hypothetical protein HATV-3_gp61 [Haloarcula tailed virus 3]|uniref:Uncharacterized protein n=1 Tax=Haloarcula tailed virus 3 TaxID=2877990 RepID=A0AAE9BZL5_9CAUD|nr:hypothetical protein M1M35_gp61 [Haloarcula tailed virus 3]UBF23411.1 hypothetical protein HATV-3_gp61 [Haloarcula tailed virus 3]
MRQSAEDVRITVSDEDYEKILDAGHIIREKGPNTVVVSLE